MLSDKQKFKKVMVFCFILAIIIVLLGFVGYKVAFLVSFIELIFFSHYLDILTERIKSDYYLDA